MELTNINFLSIIKERDQIHLTFTKRFHRKKLKEEENILNYTFPHFFFPIQNK